MSIEKHLEDEVVTLLQSNSTLSGISDLTIAAKNRVDLTLPIVFVSVIQTGTPFIASNLYLGTFSLDVEGYISWREDTDGKIKSDIHKGILETMSDSNLVNSINTSSSAIHVYENSVFFEVGFNEITDNDNWKVGVSMNANATLI